MGKVIIGIDAEQYTGDKKFIKKFLDIKDLQFDQSSGIVTIPGVAPGAPNWNLRQGDYVQKTKAGFIVWSEPVFKGMVEAAAQLEPAKEGPEVKEEVKQEPVKEEAAKEDTSEKVELPHLNDEMDTKEDTNTDDVPERETRENRNRKG